MLGQFGSKQDFFFSRARRFRPLLEHAQRTFQAGVYYTNDVFIAPNPPSLQQLVGGVHCLHFIPAGESMKSLLLVEDDPKDVRVAAEAARSLGIVDIDAHTSVQSAQVRLDKGLRDEVPLPDAIVLDLNLGYESGYELLRFWHRTPRLNKIPLIVWSVLGEEQRGICELFKVNSYVAKWEGEEAFRRALADLQQPTMQ